MRPAAPGSAKRCAPGCSPAHSKSIKAYKAAKAAKLSKSNKHRKLQKGGQNASKLQEPANVAKVTKSVTSHSKAVGIATVINAPTVTGKQLKSHK